VGGVECLIVAYVSVPADKDKNFELLQGNQQFCPTC